MLTAIIQTHSGKMIDLLNPDPYAIVINDIAHALAHLCRFGGHCKEYYSVANHSLLVALNVPKEDALTGLLHDATEAYCQDLVYPLKRILPAYKDIEAGLWEAIAWRYKLPDALPASVKDIDTVVCVTEIRDMLNGDTSWMQSNGGPINKIKPLKERIHPLSIAASRSAFLKHFHYLRSLQHAKS